MDRPDRISETDEMMTGDREGASVGHPTGDRGEISRTEDREGISTNGDRDGISDETTIGDRGETMIDRRDGISDETTIEDRDGMTIDRRDGISDEMTIEDRDGMTILETGDAIELLRGTIGNRRDGEMIREIEEEEEEVGEQDRGKTTPGHRPGETTDPGRRQRGTSRDRWKNRDRQGKRKTAAGRRSANVSGLSDDWLGRGRDSSFAFGAFFCHRKQNEFVKFLIPVIDQNIENVKKTICCVFTA